MFLIFILSKYLYWRYSVIYIQSATFIPTKNTSLAGQTLTRGERVWSHSYSGVFCITRQIFSAAISVLSECEIAIASACAYTRTTKCVSASGHGSCMLCVSTGDFLGPQKEKETVFGVSCTNARDAIV